MRGIRSIAVSVVVFGALTLPAIVAAEDEPQPVQTTTTDPGAEPATAGQPGEGGPGAEVQTEPPPASSSQGERGTAVEARVASRKKRREAAAQASAVKFVLMPAGKFTFDPSRLEVKKGDTVEWTNEDKLEHNVTADNGSFKSEQRMTPGSTFRHTFDKNGTFAYSCTLHNGMTGKIVVGSTSSPDALTGGSGGSSSGSDSGSSFVPPPLDTVGDGSAATGGGSSGTLPSTGSHLLTLALLGVDLLLAGLVLKQALDGRRA